MSHERLHMRGVTRASRLVNRLCTAVFGRHADKQRHAHNRYAHRGANIATGFRTYIARLYGAAWVIGGGAAVVVFGVTHSLVGAGLVGIGGRVVVVWFGCRYLHWRAMARQHGLEQTLPAAVRHLRILSSGELDGREMLAQVADEPQLYGETAVSFRRVLNRAQLTGSLSRGLRETAKETPSDVYSSFLLRLQAAIAGGERAVTDHLELEARILKDHQRRGRSQRTTHAELISELVIVVLVLPAAVAVLVTTAGVFVSGVHAPIDTPAGPVPVSSVVMYGCVGGVLVVGVAASVALHTLLRPMPRSGWALPEGIRPLLRTVVSNPTSTAIVLAPVTLGISWWLSTHALDGLTAVLYGYALFAIPTGLVGLRFEQRAFVMNRELREFVHGLAAVTGRGRAFSAAVEELSTKYTLGRLAPAVSSLAFDLRVSAQATAGVREAALTKFAATAGTPLARRLAVILSGALSAGCETPKLFELLEEDLDQVYHQVRAQQTMLRGYVVVVWATALSTAAILAAIGVFVLEGITQLAASTRTTTELPSASGAITAGITDYQLYVLAATNALACGWVAGVLTGSRGGAFLHSGVLVLIVFMGFRLLGVA